MSGVNQGSQGEGFRFGTNEGTSSASTGMATSYPHQPGRGFQASSRGYHPQNRGGGYIQPQNRGGGYIQPQNRGGGYVQPQNRGGGYVQPQNRGGGNYQANQGPSVRGNPTQAAPRSNANRRGRYQSARARARALGYYHEPVEDIVTPPTASVSSDGSEPWVRPEPAPYVWVYRSPSNSPDEQEKINIEIENYINKGIRPSQQIGNIRPRSSSSSDHAPGVEEGSLSSVADPIQPPRLQTADSGQTATRFGMPTTIRLEDVLFGTNGEANRDARDTAGGVTAQVTERIAPAAPLGSRGSHVDSRFMAPVYSQNLPLSNSQMPLTLNQQSTLESSSGGQSATGEVGRDARDTTGGGVRVQHSEGLASSSPPVTRGSEVTTGSTVATYSEKLVSPPNIISAAEGTIATELPTDSIPLPSSHHDSIETKVSSVIATNSTGPQPSNSQRPLTFGKQPTTNLSNKSEFVPLVPAQSQLDGNDGSRSGGGMQGSATKSQPQFPSPLETSSSTASPSKKFTFGRQPVSLPLGSNPNIPSGPIPGQSRQETSISQGSSTPAASNVANNLVSNIQDESPSGTELDTVSPADEIVPNAVVPAPNDVSSEEVFETQNDEPSEGALTHKDFMQLLRKNNRRGF